MMRFFLALCVLLAGCLPKETPPIADDYIPYIAVAIGLTAGSRVVPDVPSDTCQNCGGSGYLGDGTTKVDCPSCEKAWQKLPLETEPPDSLPEAINTETERTSLPYEPIVAHDSERLSELDRMNDAPGGSDIVDAVQWQVMQDFTFATERKLARKTDRNLVIVFTMPESCEPCRIQDDVVFESPAVLEYLDANCVMAWVDYSEQPDTVKAWCDDSGAPAVVVVSRDGKWKRVGGGKVSVASFLKFVKSSISELEKL